MILFDRIYIFCNIDAQFIFLSKKVKDTYINFKCLRVFIHPDYNTY